MISDASGFAFDQLQCCNSAILQAAGGLINSNSNRQLLHEECLSRALLPIISEEEVMSTFTAEQCVLV